MDIQVTREPRTYDIDAPHSFFIDQALASIGDRPAQTRLERYFSEVSSEIERGSVEGRRALREREQQLRAGRPSSTRAELEREARAATSATLAGFTTPQYLIDQYSIYRSTHRTFADQCFKLPLPSVGLAVHVPRLTVQSSAGIQAEGGAVSETDPSSQDMVEAVRTVATQITTSSQTIDRTQNTPDGVTFDVVLYRQLKESYDAQLNGLVLGRALSDGNSVSPTSATFSMANFYSDLALAREKMQDTSGARIQATHAFTTPDLYGYATRQVDTTGRPLIVPTLAPGTPQLSDPGDPAGRNKWAQFTGTYVPGMLAWFVDGGIPAVGSNTQVVVSRPDTILVMEGEPYTRAFAQTAAQNLQVVVQLYAYVVALPRLPDATAYFTGNAYPLTSV